jgi:hypothetical protein
MLYPDGGVEYNRYSELKVMRSGAGYYVGTSYRDPEFDFDVPGSRDTVIYFATATEAKAELENIIAGNLTNYRYHP